MAHTAGDFGPSRPEPQTTSYGRYRGESETLPPLKAETGIYHPSERFPPVQTQISYTSGYTRSPDPSLQLPPLKNVEGFTEAPTLPHIQRIPSPKGESQQQPATYYQHAGNQPTHYLSPKPRAVSAPEAQPEPVRQQSQTAESPPDRAVSSDKHRKEIKRRTKTGCLTCRKRRIKVSCRAIAAWIELVTLGTVTGDRRSRSRLRYRVSLPEASHRGDLPMPTSTPLTTFADNYLCNSVTKHTQVFTCNCLSKVAVLA